MTNRLKGELAVLRQHIAALKNAQWLGSSRSWWPDNLFHCTDLLNAVSILRHGELLSRVQAMALGRLRTDIASPDVISKTPLEWQDYVRLYFRPKTPTQYANEGFRPIGQQQLGSHCPVPIYFLFDAVSVLSQNDVLFTPGNMAAGTTPINDIGRLREVPFELVYHNTWLDPSERDTIVFHRNAEVLKPQQLDLQGLRMICCRSQAEYETFIHLLPAGTQALWVDKIGVRPNLGLFNSNWTFVELVTMTSKRLYFRFNKGTQTPGPFNARVEIVEPVTGLRYTWNNNSFHADDVLDLSLHTVKNPIDYSVHLWFDDNLAFMGRYQEDDLPF